MNIENILVDSEDQMRLCHEVKLEYSIRDLFAMIAMNKFMDSIDLFYVDTDGKEKTNFDILSKRSWAVADSMLEKRNK